MTDNEIIDGLKKLVKRQKDAINHQSEADLTIMLELKTEIKELKNIISVYNAYHPTEKGGGE